MAKWQTHVSRNLKMIHYESEHSPGILHIEISQYHFCISFLKIVVESMADGTPFNI